MKRILASAANLSEYEEHADRYKILATEISDALCDRIRHFSRIASRDLVTIQTDLPLSGIGDGPRPEHFGRWAYSGDPEQDSGAHLEHDNDAVTEANDLLTRVHSGKSGGMERVLLEVDGEGFRFMAWPWWRHGTEWGNTIDCYASAWLPHALLNDTDKEAIVRDEHGLMASNSTQHGDEKLLEALSQAIAEAEIFGEKGFTPAADQGPSPA